MWFCWILWNEISLDALVLVLALFLELETPGDSQVFWSPLLRSGIHRAEYRLKSRGQSRPARRRFIYWHGTVSDHCGAADVSSPPTPSPWSQSESKPPATASVSDLCLATRHPRCKKLDGCGHFVKLELAQSSVGILAKLHGKRYILKKWALWVMGMDENTYKKNLLILQTPKGRTNGLHDVLRLSSSLHQ